MKISILGIFVLVVVLSQNGAITAYRSNPSTVVNYSGPQYTDAEDLSYPDTVINYYSRPYKDYSHASGPDTYNGPVGPVTTVDNYFSRGKRSMISQEVPLQHISLPVPDVPGQPVRIVGNGVQFTGPDYQVQKNSNYLGRWKRSPYGVTYDYNIDQVVNYNTYVNVPRNSYEMTDMTQIIVPENLVKLVRSPKSVSRPSVNDRIVLRPAVSSP